MGYGAEGFTDKKISSLAIKGAIRSRPVDFEPKQRFTLKVAVLLVFFIGVMEQKMLEVQYSAVTINI